MTQIARKLPSKAKPWPLFMAEGRIKFFCGCGEKRRICRTRSVREIRAFGPQTRKYFLVVLVDSNGKGLIILKIILLDSAPLRNF